MAQQELEVTMTLKAGLEQQGQTILNFHFLTVTLIVTFYYFLLYLDFSPFLLVI